MKKNRNRKLSEIREGCKGDRFFAFLAALLTILSCFAQAIAGHTQELASNPNILFLMTDTQRKDDMGAYGNPVIRTPHLDLLAKEGVRFEQCYTQYPACMPSRAAIFTGRYPMANGVWSNGVPLPVSETTLAEVLLKNGYETGGFGKLHFLPHYPYRKAPLPIMGNHSEPFYGFETFRLGEDGRSGEHWKWLEEHHPQYADRADHEIPPEFHNTLWTANHTIQFIQRCVKERKPFFAFCSFVDPHQSYNPPPPYRTMYREQDMPPPIRRQGELDGSHFQEMASTGNMANYNEKVAHHRTQHYGEMTFIDDAVGRIVAVLEKLKIREKTLVIFTSDHGDMLGDHWLWWKGPFHYAGCSNIPLFFNWPGQLKEGKVVDGLTQHIDIFPTVLDLARIECPPGVQGRSQKSVLTSENSDTGYDFVYLESVHSGAHDPSFWTGKQAPPEAVDTFTIRNRKWRLTFFTDGDGELYDLAKDPNEFENVWSHPLYEKEKWRLIEVLLRRIAVTRDPLPLRTKPY